MRIPRWFMPVSGELKLGGRYQLEGNAGGVVETCVPMAQFTATWEFGGDVSWIEASFSEDAPGARLTLNHIALLSPHWDEYGPGAVGVGWDTGLLGLALHIDAPRRAQGGRRSLRSVAHGQGVHRGLQRCVGIGGNRRWRRPGSRACSRPADDGVLHGRARPNLTAIRPARDVIHHRRCHGGERCCRLRRVELRGNLAVPERKAAIGVARSRWTTAA